MDMMIIICHNKKCSGAEIENIVPMYEDTWICAICGQEMTDKKAI